MSKRIEWLDIAKGITIILMVLGHSSIPKPISNWIWSFHMPLFFFASGICTVFERTGVMDFFRKKVMSIGRPFVVYSVVVIVISYISKIKIDASIMTGWGAYALWFVPVLFVSLLLARFYFVFKGGGRFLYLFLLPFSSYILSILHIHLPWNMSVAPYASMLLLYAYWHKDLIKSIPQFKWYWLVITFTITTIVSLFYRLDMCYNNIRPILVLSVGAISGSLFIAIISAYIDKIGGVIAHILKQIGKETFIILAFSQIVILVINRYMVINPIWKYSLLILSLVMIKYTKDCIVLLYKRCIKTSPK